MKKILLTAAILGLTISLNAQQSTNRRYADIEHRPVVEHRRQHGHDVAHKHQAFDAQTMAAKKAIRLKEDLLLSDKQYDEVYKVYYDSFKEIEKQKVAKEGVPVDEKAREEERAKHESARAEQLAKIEKPMKKILSAEQFKRWKEMETNRKPHQKNVETQR